MTEAQLPVGGDDEEVQASGQEDVPMTEGRDRKALAEEIELSPMSLVGSYFHRWENDEIIWGGQVIAEPQPGKYLLHVRRPGAVDTEEVQLVVGVEQMIARDEGYEFRFFDTKEQMTDAYAQYAVRKMAT